jgi:predicted nucleic acid-binding protein
VRAVYRVFQFPICTTTLLSWPLYVATHERIRRRGVAQAGRPWPAIRQTLDHVKVLCPTVLPLTLDTHVRALDIAGRTGYRFFDALIIASALGAGCGTLFSEDLQAGQRIDGRLTIRNPFPTQSRP